MVDLGLFLLAQLLQTLTDMLEAAVPVCLFTLSRCWPWEGHVLKRSNRGFDKDRTYSQAHDAQHIQCLWEVVLESRDLILGERHSKKQPHTAALTSVVTHTVTAGSSYITRGVAEAKAASRWRCEKHFGPVTLLMNMWNVAVFDFHEHRAQI